jgi:DNA polymerase III epsilon subunit-like protein
MELAQGFVDKDDRSLEGLTRLFKLPFEPTHHAVDDVNATAALLMRLMPLSKQHTEDRMRVVRDTGRWFAPLTPWSPVVIPSALADGRERSSNAKDKSAIAIDRIQSPSSSRSITVIDELAATHSLAGLVRDEVVTINPMPAPPV